EQLPGVPTVKLLQRLRVTGSYLPRQTPATIRQSSVRSRHTCLEPLRQQKLHQRAPPLTNTVPARGKKVPPADLTSGGNRGLQNPMDPLYRWQGSNTTGSSQLSAARAGTCPIEADGLSAPRIVPYWTTSRIS